MRVWLPADRSRRLLTIAVLCSLLLHILLGVVAYMAGRWQSPVIAKRGEPLFVDIAPDKPEERAPQGNPSRPPGPDRPVPEPRRKSAQPAAAPRPAPPAPAPRVAETPKAPAPPRVAAAPVSPAPESSAAPVPLPKTPEREVSPAPPRPESPPAPGRPQEVQDPRFALSRPSLDNPPGIFRRPGGGGGLRGGGRGGVEGEPIPLDTPDPRYQDYFTQVRQRIQANWVYPREAGERGIGGQLVIEFHIAKDGRLAFVELERSSGAEILDEYAMRAIQLAEPFPPVPDSVAKRVLPISGRFTYQIVGDSFVNQFLR